MIAVLSTLGRTMGYDQHISNSSLSRGGIVRIDTNSNVILESDSIIVTIIIVVIFKFSISIDNLREKQNALFWEI